MNKSYWKLWVFSLMLTQSFSSSLCWLESLGWWFPKTRELMISHKYLFNPSFLIFFLSSSSFFFFFIFPYARWFSTIKIPQNPSKQFILHGSWIPKPINQVFNQLLGCFTVLNPKKTIYIACGIPNSFFLWDVQTQTHTFLDFYLVTKLSLIAFGCGML